MLRPWQKLKSKVVHKNPFFKVRVDDVLAPKGFKTKYFYVDKIGKSVSIVAEDKDGKIYLVGQSKYPSGNNYSWETVAGGGEGSESLLRSAKRELREEAGLVAKKWISLGYYYPSGGTCNQIVYIYLAKDLKMIKSEPDPTELIKIRKETLANIIKMIKSNEITDGYTIIAVYKYLLYKNNL
jgi:8-oxo-dGTP pyrophosphatase MutT (NUDIX family)